MRFRVLPAILLASYVASAAIAKSPIIYDFIPSMGQDATVIGSITTDGSIGNAIEWDESLVLDYAFAITENGVTKTLTPDNSYYSSRGLRLNLTETEIFLDESSVQSIALGFDYLTIGGIRGTESVETFVSVQANINGRTPSGTYFGSLDGNAMATGATLPFTLATARVIPTPTASALALVAIVCAMGRRSRA